MVGGIGVMNIMLVSVTERTREIGLKIAIGARKSRILWQFLTEAAVLTSLGGLLGVLCGIGLAEMLSHVMGTAVAISAPACIVAVAFSMVIGIVFGLVPAVKASRLNPIEALRRGKHPKSLRRLRRDFFLPQALSLDTSLIPLQWRKICIFKEELHHDHWSGIRHARRNRER